MKALRKVVVIAGLLITGLLRASLAVFVVAYVLFDTYPSKVQLPLRP